MFSKKPENNNHENNDIKQCEKSLKFFQAIADEKCREMGGDLIQGYGNLTKSLHGNKDDPHGYENCRQASKEAMEEAERCLKMVRK
ncbi:MAG: hypothetical protein ACD_46C00712G0012 [uncultured bacterium]|nr:MAG: hypothetical protein ACD_46C00712G0012 [uncultured bacterium]